MSKLTILIIQSVCLFIVLLGAIMELATDKTPDFTIYFVFPVIVGYFFSKALVDYIDSVKSRNADHQIK